MVRNKVIAGFILALFSLVAHEALALKKGFAIKETYPNSFALSGSTATYCPSAAASAITANSTNTSCNSGTNQFVTVTVNWYQNTSQSQVGATLVKTTSGSASVTSYTYTPPTTSNGTLYYYAIISWSATNCAPTGSFTTGYFTVIVTPPVLSSVSQASAVCSGTNATINLTGLMASTTQQISYNINGGSTQTTFVTSTSSGTGNFPVAVTSTNNGQTLTVTKIFVNSGCTTNFGSNNSTILSVNSTPTITSQPSTSGQNLCKNSIPADLTVSASAGSGSISTYQWYSNTTNSNSGGTLVATHASSLSTDSYTPVTSIAGTLYYYCIVTNSNNCTITSNVSGAIVVSNGGPNITAQPSTATQNVCINGTSTALSITATGSGTTYQWFSSPNSNGSSSTLISGATATSYTPLTTSVGTLYYYCVASNGCSVTSNVSGAVIIIGNNTSALSSASGTDAQTVCINTAITNITYTTTGATGATFSGLPSGVNGNWSSNTATISGTPTASGPFSYTVTLTGGCGSVTSNGTISVTPDNTSTLSSSAGTDAQTVCINTAIANITYATTGATGATFSGLPSGVTGNWSSNVATISGTPTTSGPFSYTVTLTGGCGSVTSTGTISVTPDNTSTLSSAAGTDAQTVCPNTAITNITYATTGATGATFSGLPSGVTGNWSANVATISGTPTVSGVFNYLVSLTGGCGSVTSGGTITIGASGSTTWTGNTSTNWSDATNWSCGLPTGLIDVDIPFGLINYPVVGVGTTVSVKKLNIDFGASLQLNSTSILQISGDFTNFGVFTSGGGTVDFNGSALQKIGGVGNTVMTFDNISVTNTTSPVSVSVESDQNLSGVLTLSTNSTFDADGTGGTSIFTLLSTSDLPTVDASIATLPAGASVSGNVTVQRFMGRSGTATYDYQVYRDISAPVSSTVSDLQNYLPVSGPFTNSSVVTTDGVTPDGTVDYSVSALASYTESATGAVSNGWVDFPAAGGNTQTASFVQGKGYSLFIFGSDYPVLQNGNAKWSLTGSINSGSISMPVTLTYTGTGGTYNSNTDGWNFVGNPYPSTIDWSSALGWTKTKINNAIYIDDFSSGSDVFASYVNGVSTNGGSRYIAMGQGFWVKANALSPVLGVDERVKVGGQQTSFYRESSPSNLLRVTLTSSQAVRDEAVIYFDEAATEDFDSQYDAYKLMNRYPAFNISTKSSNGEKYSINAMAFTDCAKTVSLDISDVTTGVYNLKFSDFESMPSSTEIMFKDNFKNELVNVRQQTSYAFEVDLSNSATFGSNRFSLIFNFNGSAAKDCNSAPTVGVTAFPNPVKETITIEAVGDDEAHGEIYNSLGVSMANLNFTPQSSKQSAQFDFKKESNGIYFVRVSQGDRVTIIRVIKD